MEERERERARLLVMWPHKGRWVGITAPTDFPHQRLLVMEVKDTVSLEPARNSVRSTPELNPHPGTTC
jgi:hypothetical protein